MTDERTLIPRFERAIWCFAPGESLATALGYMRDEDFSQIVARQEGELRLLSAEGITRWLQQQAGAVDLTRVTVGEVLALEPSGTFRVLAGADTVEAARRALAAAPRVFAVIITASGHTAEPPLGIVTPWDLEVDR